MSAFQPPSGYEPDSLFDGPSRHKKRRPRNRRHDFVDLPLRKRRDMAVSMGWKIRSYPDGAGQFMSIDYIPGDRKWPVDASNEMACQWAHIYLVGSDYRRRGAFYNATILTLAHRLADMIEVEASDVLRARMPPGSDRVRAYSKKHKGGVSMVFAPQQPIDEFGGMTRNGKLAQIIEDLAATIDSRSDLHGFAKIEEGYRYGIGLEMVVPEPGLTVEKIAYWVERFRHDGETDAIWNFSDHGALAESVSQARSALGYKAWRLRCIQASDLGWDPPEAPTDPKGAIMVAAQSNAIKV